MVVADWEVRLESKFEAETNKKGTERTTCERALTVNKYTDTCILFSIRTTHSAKEMQFFRSL